MIVGFTGTRRGMSKDQLASFSLYIAELPSLAAFHHGACLGADEQAVLATLDIAGYAGREFPVIAHPCEITTMQSRAAIEYSDEVKLELPPLTRNANIVAACDTLIATPEGPEVGRSGTWSTVRATRRQSKHITIVWPDGSVTEEFNP